MFKWKRFIFKIKDIMMSVLVWASFWVCVCAYASVCLCLCVRMYVYDHNIMCVFLCDHSMYAFVWVWRVFIFYGMAAPKVGKV